MELDFADYCRVRRRNKLFGFKEMEKLGKNIPFSLTEVLPR